MKKIAVAVLISTLLLTAANAYNPPVGAEDMCLLSSPTSLSGGTTVTGGALFSVGAESIVVNPALTADEQRVNLNLGCTLLLSGNDMDENSIGSAFQTSILIPMKMYVFSGYVNGTFAPFTQEMYLGDSFNAKAGLSKEITEKLNVGASISGGYTWKYGSDWALGANLGFVFKYGDLGFMKNFRYGASVLNLGKNYSDVGRLPIQEDAKITAYPSLATLKLGAAGSFFKNDTVEIGGALDFTIPAFQNLIVDLNLQASIKDMLVVSLGEKINIVEAAKNHGSFIPSIGLIFKFSFDVKNNEYLASKDWSQSEMTVSASYRNLYQDIHAISAGVDIDLGMKDTAAPEIVIWNE